jgi:hypothetical protein
MKSRIVFLLITLLLAASCTSKPPASTVPPPEAPAVVEPVAVEPVAAEPPVAVPVVEVVFDPGTISQEVHTATLVDVQHLIQDLNGIIRAKNYKAWITYLAESYFSNISSPAYLGEQTTRLYNRDVSEILVKGGSKNSVRKRELRNAQDYFINVVVPSRANDHVDDIVFITQNKVRAFTVDSSNGKRLVLYDLENVNGSWKITNPEEG